MRHIIRLVVAFVALVSVMAAYPHFKFEQDYFVSWWIVARAVAPPYYFITLRVVGGNSYCLLSRTILAICYCGSVLAIGRWFLAPRYPLFDVFVLMIIEGIALMFWQSQTACTQSQMLDSEHSPRVRTP